MFENSAVPEGRFKANVSVVGHDGGVNPWIALNAKESPFEGITSQSVGVSNEVEANASCNSIAAGKFFDPGLDSPMLDNLEVHL